MVDIKNIRKAYSLIEPRSRKRILRLSLMSIPGSMFEIIGLGSIPAFLYFLFSPGFLEESRFFPEFLVIFSKKSPELFLAAFSVFIIIVFITKNMFVVWIQNARLNTFYKEQTRAGKILFEKYLSAPYLVTLSRSTSEYLRNLNSEIFVIFNQFLIPLSNLFSDLIFLTLIFGFLLCVNFWMTLLATFFLFLGGYLFYIAYHKKLKYFGRQEFHHRKKRHKIVTEAFDGLKEIIFYDKLGRFTEAFHSSSESTARAMHHRLMTSFKIRPFIEIISVFGILFITLLLIFQDKELSGIIPLIALFAATAIRLLPVFKQSVLNISMLKYNQPSVEIVFNDLNEQDFVDKKQIYATENIPSVIMPEIFPITLDGIEFTYSGRKEKTLSDISFKIQKGTIVGITGRTGSGKSTLVDIIAGIFSPGKGRIMAGKYDLLKQKKLLAGKIAYIPQNPFIMDDTIEQNIVFSSGNKNIDQDRLIYSVEKSQLKDFIGRLPEGLSTVVGERGFQLSAGQIQRISIARAIYLNPDLYIFDEATSALDVETEEKFMNYVINEAKDKTFLFVTHHIQIMKKCTFLVFIEDGKISGVNNYNFMKEKFVKFNRFLSEVN